MAPANDSDPFTYWTSLEDREIDLNKIEEVLPNIHDDLLATAACADRLVDNVESQRALVMHGIQRTESALNRTRAAVTSNDRAGTELADTKKFQDNLIAHFRAATSDAQLCSLRVILLQRLDKLNTYVDVCKEDLEDKISEDGLEEWEDDPWSEEEAAAGSRSTTTSQAPFSLSDFLTNDLLHSSYRLTSLQRYVGLQTLFKRHRHELWPYRLSILDSIPEHVRPSEYCSLLPSFDPSKEGETVPAFHPWRPSKDWVEISDVRDVLKELNSLPPLYLIPLRATPYSHPLSGDELSTWYKTRAELVLNSTGLVDNALALIQHGAAQGIPGLDELGEDLSLLSRLVYDSHQIPGSLNDWSLSRWRSMDASNVVRAYLAYSTAESVAKDIARLVMPYLFVLESRAERNGKPDPELPTRLLYDYILSCPLELVASLFTSSKPTLPLAQRLIRDEEGMSRLALACLYGNGSLDEWPTMSQIFECLPAWDAQSQGDNDDDGDVVNTTILSLGAFVAPSTSRPQCTPSELFLFFRPLPRTLLSKMLDTLDIHLESGEILSRWNVPVPLRWFLQSNHDVAAQRAWANRMSRRAGNPEDRLNTLEDWEWLLEDMLKISGTSDANTSSAFGLLKPDEVKQLFFSGLLSTGKFDIARSILGSKNGLTLRPEQIEELCLTCSREFYDNAQSGNYKLGEMKLAYGCLDVPGCTERIKREKEFIEATSRISSFNVTSRPGIPLSPLEIRLTKDRLSLVSRVLSSNNDAYKYPEVILDLVHKLGFQGDISAEVRALAMMADAALQAEDFSRAYDLCECMVNTVLNFRTTGNLDEVRAAEASEVCWVACFQLGRQLEFDDTQKKMVLLGRALELCPADKIHEVLTPWRRLEKDDIQSREGRLSDDQVGNPTSVPSGMTVPRNVALSLRDRLKDLHMPSPAMLTTPDAAILASRTFKSVASSFPFSVGHRTSQSDAFNEGSHSRSSDGDVSAQASRVLSKGIGWLIGVDE